MQGVPGEEGGGGMTIEWDELVAVAKASGATEEIAEAMARLITKAYEIAAEEEREACARLCDKIERRKWETIAQGGLMQGIGARDCAAAIRARGEK